MAKRARKRTTKAGASAKKYILLASDCGGVEQLSAVNDEAGGEYIFTSMAAAKAAAQSNIAMNGQGNTYVIAEIVEVAKAIGVSWTGKTEI